MQVNFGLEIKSFGSPCPNVITDDLDIITDDLDVFIRSNHLLKLNKEPFYKTWYWYIIRKWIFNVNHLRHSTSNEKLIKTANEPDNGSSLVTTQLQRKVAIVNYRPSSHWSSRLIKPRAWPITIPPEVWTVVRNRQQHQNMFRSTTFRLWYDSKKFKTTLKSKTSSRVKHYEQVKEISAPLMRPYQ